MVSNKLGDFPTNSLEHIKVLCNNYGIKIVNLSLDNLTEYLFDKRKNTESKFMLSKDDFLSFEVDNKSTQKSFIAKISLIDIVRIFSNSIDLTNKYNLEDDTEVLDCNLNISLLYDNVRGYLEGTTFNKNIKETLDKNYNNFFMFNNGVTIIAEEIISEPKNSNEKYLFTIKNFQIVNGGQTIRTIFAYMEDIKNENKSFYYRNTFVLLRLFKIEKESGLKNEIAEYTNSQNQISAYDLKSVDSIQIQIEHFLKTHNILYVRKAGDIGSVDIEYDNRISKEELAQIIYSIKGYPDRAINHKIKLFTDYYDDIFPKQGFEFDKILKYIEDYRIIKSAMDENKNEVLRVMYVCYIINASSKSIDDAIEYFSDFINRKKGNNNIAISRFLLQKNVRENLIDELKLEFNNNH